MLARNPYNAEFGERVAFLGRRLAAARRDDRSRPSSWGAWALCRARPRCDRVGLAGNGRSRASTPARRYQVHLDMDPGEGAEVHFLLGEGEDREQALQLIEHVSGSPSSAEAACARPMTAWDALLDTGPGADAGRGDGSAAQPLAALPGPVLSHLGALGASTSRAAPMASATSCRT